MAEDKNKYILSIQGMSKSFGRNKVLNHINLNVKPGSIMGLMGENGAGKSTMMKCLFGTYQKDEGTIILDGKEVNFSGPKDALENGVAMVHQELNQCLERSVVDNLFLGRYPKNSLGVIDEGRMKKEASDLFRKLGITVNLTQPMKRMSVSQRQMCEIAKAISYNSKVIVLDEPTSSLTAPEVAKLFKMMRQLKEQGISLIYISHKMDEIFEICDQISVLRDGSLVMTKDSKDTNMNELISAMVGRSLDNRFPPVDNTPGETILSVQGLSTKYAPKLQNITFDVKKGEIFGLYGLVGAGRTELLETIFGIRTRAAGRVYYDDKLMNFNSSKDAMDHGFALITEERKADGLFLKADITFNTTIANMNQYKSGIALSKDEMVRATAEEIRIMHTKCMGPDDMIANLSGGNQQKVFLARWLNTDAETHYMAVHLEWEDLENQLNELIRSLLSAAYTVHMKRSDFYYWDIVLYKDGEISEKDSEYICERLDLRDISTDHFLYSDSIDQNQACGLLEKLFGREIVSSHADDEGVWFFHKPLYASSRSWVAQHVGRFEQRLNMEIGNRHYPATTAETAAHQLYGFVTALKALGMVREHEYPITLDHFTKRPNSQPDQANI